MLSKKKYLIVMISTFFSPFMYGSLSKSNIHKIGKRIWHNETGKHPEYLVFWNPHENFPSLGIGHFIWLPRTSTEPYSQQFPELCLYLMHNGVKLPAWLMQALPNGAPWNNRTEFLNDTKRTTELRQLLIDTIPLQTQFIINRLEKQWPQIHQAAPLEQQKHIARAYHLLRSSALGNYALIDYLNFKGDGLNPKEQCAGKGWGLLQVLMEMPKNITIQTAPQHFSTAAAKVLTHRVRHTPKHKLDTFYNGWMKRVRSYADHNLFK